MPRKRKKTTVTRRRTRTKRASSRSKQQAQLQLKTSTQRQISGISQIGLSIFLILVLRGEAGALGEAINTGLTFLLGKWGMVFPVFLLFSGIFHCFALNSSIELKRTTGLVLCFFAFMGMAHLHAPPAELSVNMRQYAGAIGFMMSVPFVLFASKAVGYTVLTCVFVAGIFVAFEPDIGALWHALLKLRAKPKTVAKRTATTGTATDTKTSEPISKKQKVQEEDSEDLVELDVEEPELNIVRPVFAKQVVEEKAQKNVQEKTQKKVVKQDELEMKDTRFEEWTFPGYELLEDAQSQLTVKDEDLMRQAKLIEEKLEEFGIQVTMRDAHPGPTVTQFTLQPSEGVKLSKIGGLKDDLALALSAQSLRIEAPIPGKGLVGIEMPNVERTTVHLREILESPQFTQSTSSLTLPLGRDVSGDAVVASLEDMPHLLIAGATGSGKSVCMNTFLLSLLFQNAPHELKLILIDPKRVELSPYDNIPHLLTPVITDSDKALQALRWAVAEMGRRLHRFSETGVRNIDEYNDKQDNEETVLPRIVIVVDELADLMMRQYRRDTETMVARVAQMARAVGMHLIIATQRPSVDVITGLIKANIPTRIAFRTVSAVDSRTILDGVGSEDLLGKGDMLYMTANTQNPVRIQGILVGTKEVERVINSVKIAGGGEMTEQIPLIGEDDDEENDMQAGLPQSQYIDLEADDNGGDDMFFDAVRVVQETGKASASLLQRRLSVGYARAAKLLDIMEEKNLIGPSRGAKAREVYMDAVSAT